MLFAFVACNPDSSSSSSSQEDEPLPNEVTPPAESERKSMSDVDILKVSGYFDILYENSKTDVVRENKVEVDFGDSGSLSIKEDRNEKDHVYDATFTATGEMILGSDSYVVDNLVLVCKGKYGGGVTAQYTIEKGSVTKNAATMSAEEAYYFLSSTESFNEDSKCKAYTAVENKQTKFEIFDNDGETIGNGTEIEKVTSINNEEKGVWVYDFTVKGSRIQCKIRYSEKEGESIDYFALDGVFFDKASCEKLMDLIY